jgi:hypothetical protein
MKICSLLCLAGVLALAAAAVPCLAVQPPSPPEQPCLLKAKLTVNGVAVAASSASSYTMAVTDTSGNPLDDQASGNPTVIYSPVVAGAAPRFEYEIPMSATSTPSAACLTVSYKGTPLYLTYPAQGACPDGEAEITGLTAGGMIGFGGLDGDSASDTFVKSLTAVTASGPTAGVVCSGSRVTTIPFGSVDVGQPAGSITGCSIKNLAPSTTNLNVSGMSASGCGFAVVSPTTFPVSLEYTQTQAMDLTFTPCAVGAQTGTLTISSNDPINPSYNVALTGTGATSLPLVKGWNLIGLPAVPTHTALATVLSAILPKVSVVWAYINGQWVYYDPNDPAGSALTMLTIGNGYWVYMTGAATLTIH